MSAILRAIINFSLSRHRFVTYQPRHYYATVHDAADYERPLICYAITLSNS